MTPPKRKRQGRRFTAAESAQIQTMIESGASAATIARAAACSRTTLRKYFGKALAERPRNGNSARVWTVEERELVRLVAAVGIEHSDLAAVLGVSTGTLKATFTEELATAKARLDTAVAATIVRGALTGGSERFAIHYARCRIPGWNDRARPAEGDDPLAGDAQAEQIRLAVDQLDQKGRDALRLVVTQLGAASPLTADTRPQRLH